MTEEPIESVYAGVVSIRGIRLVMFLAELNNLDCWAADVSQAYLTSYTTEKVYIVAGPEFGERENHILVIRKALYGLRASGKNYGDLFSEFMYKMGFTPCVAEPDIWLRPNEELDCYEYVACYVDDLAIAMSAIQS